MHRGWVRQLDVCNTCSTAFECRLNVTMHVGWQVVYILTLGVVERVRRRGVAGQLLRLVLSAASGRGCRAWFLDVITYIHAAISFYLGHAFNQLAQLHNFYYISCAPACQLMPLDEANTIPLQTCTSNCMHSC